MRSYGINVRVAKNQSIRAAAGGQVIFNGDVSGFGPTVIIDHGKEYVSVYGNVKSGTTVNQMVAGGQELGKSAGVDIHFELRRGDQALNPLAWLRPQ